MEEWRKVNEQKSGGDKLAEFPGTIYLGTQSHPHNRRDCKGKTATEFLVHNQG